MLDRIRSALAGRYDVERELGAGGMATVFLARDEKHNRKVAVKVLRPEIAATLGAERFSREIEVAAQLQHPHILPLLDSGEADGFFYYVMPFVEGESLRDRLAHRGELPVHDAVKILVEVADALVHAHSHGVVHRDIKPDNILLSGRHALITDFGVAKAVSEATGRQQLTTAGVALGTPAYMAPEQATADPHLDQRVDIYALGVLGYELLTGRPPFTGRSPQEVLAAQVTQAPEPLERYRPGLSSALTQVLMKCLEKRPADRWQTAEELLAQLEPLATPSGGTTPTTTRPIAVGVGGGGARTRRGPVAAAAGVVAVVAIGVLLSRGGAPGGLQLERRTQVTLDPGLEIDPALSPDGKFIAYVAGPLGQTRLEVRQVDGGAPIQVVRDRSGPERFPSWTPDGRRIVFLSPRGLEIVPALGGPSRVLVAAAGVPPIPGPVARDGGSVIYVSSESLYVQPLDGGKPRLVTVAREPHSPAWSPDGRWIAYVSGNSGYASTESFGNIAPSSISVVAAAGGAATRVTDDQSLNVSPAWGPGGSLLFVSSREGGRDIYQVTLKRSGEPAGPPVRLTTGLGAHSISVSTDGTRLAYTAFTETSNVWSVPIPAVGAVSISRAVPVTAGNQTIENLDVSPDGQWLAFDSDRSGPQRIYRVRLGGSGGSEPEQLTSDSADSFWPTWSPNGREIAFQGFRGLGRQVFVMSAEGGPPVQVTKGSDDERTPSWAPDGRRLLMLANQATRPQWHVVTRRPNGSWSAPAVVPLVVGRDTVAAFLGTWSPDGQLIACACPAGIGIAPSAGGPARRLAPAPPGGGFSNAQWSADGRLVYYLFSDSAGFSVRAVPVAGGTPRVVVRFDNPTRPWHRYGFRVHGGQFYFTLGDLQSDISVAGLSVKK
jgi:Tol biopolymer transport system component/tRNA A-37 threonylcarbamoyl transferase component Bud32